jgi:hypothetical protein
VPARRKPRRSRPKVDTVPLAPVSPTGPFGRVTNGSITSVRLSRVYFDISSLRAEATTDSGRRRQVL